MVSKAVFKLSDLSPRISNGLELWNIVEWMFPLWVVLRLILTVFFSKTGKTGNMYFPIITLLGHLHFFEVLPPTSYPVYIFWTFNFNSKFNNWQKFCNGFGLVFFKHANLISQRQNCNKIHIFYCESLPDTYVGAF